MPSLARSVIPRAARLVSVSHESAVECFITPTSGFKTLYIMFPVVTLGALQLIQTYY